MLNKTILKELKEYIELHQVLIIAEVLQAPVIFSDENKQIELKDFIKDNLKPSFSDTLLHYIDQKDFKDVDVYKKAGIDRRLFSKIRSNASYRPSKHSAIQLAIALELTKKETEQLLSAAGFSLSASDSFDLAIQFFIERKIYDMDSINYALDYLGEKTLTRIIE